MNMECEMKNYTFIKVKSIEQLKELAYENQIDCMIQLNGGGYSRKTISHYSDDSWDIFHHISDEWEEFTSTYDFVNDEFYGKFIQEAIEKKALLVYPNSDVCHTYMPKDEEWSESIPVEELLK